MIDFRKKHGIAYYMQKRKKHGVKTRKKHREKRKSFFIGFLSLNKDFNQNSILPSVVYHSSHFQNSIISFQIC